MGIRLTLFFILLVNAFAYGQSAAQQESSVKNNSVSNQIIWHPVASMKISETQTQHFLDFEGATYSFEDGFLPKYSQKVDLFNNEQSFTATIINASFQPLTAAEVATLKEPAKIGTEIQVTASVCKAKKQKYGTVSFIPIRRNNTTGKIEKLVSFDLSVIPGASEASNRGTRVYAANSVLQTGNWYKIAIAADGIYKLSYSFLQGLGIDLSNVNPQNIRIYGNGGGMLPELNSVPRRDDLVENAIFIQGETDGAFDPNDYILFYGQGPNSWKYSNTTCPAFTHTINLYADSAYYFITADKGVGKRIQVQPSTVLPVTNAVTSFDDYSFHENENVNFIKSGKKWFGEYFDNIASYNFSFSFPNVDGSSPANVRTTIASRFIDLVGSGNATYSVSSQSGGTSVVIPETTGDAYSDYAKTGSACYSFNPTNPTITVNVTKQTPDAVAWLDYIEVNVRRQLIMNGSQLIFRDAQSVGAGNIAGYTLTSNSPVQIWDVSDITNVKSQALTVTGNSYQFALPADSLKQFISFTGSAFNTPSFCGKVVNQNLHALSNKNFIIVAHPDFYNEAVQLAAHHEKEDTLSTIIVSPQEIYNEFSSGAQDATAIRDFVKMFYDKAANNSELPRYLLLFGDGSYDNKKRFSNNTNFIPTYQSDNSTILTSSYVSDDFYGLLDESEGLFLPSSTADVVDIGIGRFPVKSRPEAQAAINKVFRYTKKGVPVTTANNGCSNQSSDSPFGDWRNIVCFVGDDEDGDLHLSQANQLATMVDTSNDNYNVDKIYLDAYQQESTPGGERYPAVSDAINKRFEKGCLIFNYTGHGGEVGLAHERIIEVSQINKWDNINNMPLIFSATCEFSRFDDPERTSAGEYAFLNPNGAAIALFTTVRLVFASPNFYVNKSFYEAAFEPINGKMPRLGDLYAFIKSAPGGNSVNSRNFTLLGDPALTLSYPKYNVSTDTVNAVAVSALSSDTLKALSTITISGFVRNTNNSILTNYNGVLYPTVYDKEQPVTTLSNDGTSASPPYTFQLQKNILYKGKVSVINGYFSFSFVVPKDIAYKYGVGRISYYAENGTEDANGYYEKIIIGGSNNAAPNDVTGPEVSLYLNDAKFIYGGLTNENPDLFAVVKDENGINTVGNGIGHDVTAVLDGSTENEVVLNDYYQADLNSYKSGTLRYRYSDLAEGKHTLKLKVWDVFNNSSESYTEFVVAKSAELALSHVLNYPNPFTSKTQFYFEQNQCCQLLDVQVQVFTISGKLVKNISQYVHTEGFRSDPIEWDGRDDFGDKIGKGVYIYRIKVKTSEGSVAEKYEKLVILN